MQLERPIYIVSFCVGVCLVCAVLVSSAAVGLKPLQEKNQQLDRQKKVLAVAGLLDESVAHTEDEVQQLFAARIRPVIVDLEAAKPDPSVETATFDQQKATRDPARSKVAAKNPAGVARIPNRALVYYVSATPMNEKGEGFTLDQYIFPVEGKGLWSTLYGFLALAPNGNEIRGLTFYQHGETPGLGGEVDNPSWKAKWPGRLVYGPEGIAATSFEEPQIRVVKGQAGSVEATPHQVDGLSGATITSKGVSSLLQFWLGDKGFGPFIRKVAASEAS
ncbi:MAG: Na(+)-translocating NADH-quinone reductase subunit C [Myxococcales bacterium]|nr:Na(+)-translocating NADH-quinone reductase subunit C [Myxococcales bacterium]